MRAMSTDVAVEVSALAINVTVPDAPAFATWLLSRQRRLAAARSLLQRRNLYACPAGG